MNLSKRISWATALAVLTLASLTLAGRQVDSWVSLDVLVKAAAESERDARPALELLASRWKNSYAAILLDLAELNRPTRRSQAGNDVLPQTAGPQIFRGGSQDPLEAEQDPERPIDRDGPVQPRPVSPVRDRLFRFLEQRTGKRFGHDFARWHEWIWSLPYEPHPDLALFKGLLYANIDPRMRDFFPDGVQSLIRLDEVEWGGVIVNGIPPLFYPKHIEASAARYLRDDHVVFGIALNGEARAYPKRILAWHELVWDRVGGIELTIVYCTLCGTVIPYESVVGGQRRRLGTSGLLYRSNKLMFDEETKSLWSTLEGKPVIGPLAGSGLELRAHAVVTTTWGEWQRQHPETLVLAVETGHERDYSEGAAYRDYFGTDRLMFGVPKVDTRLKNKAEVLVMRVDASGGGVKSVPVAIAADFLKKRPVFQTEIAGRPIVIVTSRNGANRAYDAGNRRFAAGKDDDRVIDDLGGFWRATEDALMADAPSAESRPRLPAQRAFWFGWQAQFPDAILIK